MLHAGLDLSRRLLDVCLVGEDGDVGCEPPEGLAIRDPRRGAVEASVSLIDDLDPRSTSSTAACASATRRPL